MSDERPIPTAARPAAPVRLLTVFDSTCIIVGIIVGAGIYESSPLIAGCLPGPGWLLAFWALGGLITLVGAVCLAELAAAAHEAPLTVDAAQRE